MNKLTLACLAALCGLAVCTFDTHDSHGDGIFGGGDHGGSGHKTLRNILGGGDHHDDFGFGNNHDNFGT